MGNGPACDESSASATSLQLENGLGCSGDRLRLCAGGFEHELDCSLMAPGFTCQEVAGTAFCGLASECNPQAYPHDESCEGTQLRFCHAGRFETVDCAELGFTGCQDFGSFAVCVPSVYSSY